MKIIKISILLALICSSFIIFKKQCTPPNARWRIGILQTASHPALDAVREGFIEQLQEELHHDVQCIIQNAEGNISHAHAIAQRFHADKTIDGIFTIATPATQAQASIETKKPIFFAAVTDPHALGFVHPTTNICGASDMIDVEKEIDLLVNLVPHAKKVGLIFNTAEVNSIILISKMKNELQKRNLTPLDFGVTSEADIPAAIEVACRKTDALLAPTDNTIASTIDLIASIALKHKKPLIVSDNLLVSHGALAASGVDYKESGRQAARLAYAVLVDGKKPFELPIAQPQSNIVLINKKTLGILGLTIPKTSKIMLL